MKNTDIKALNNKELVDLYKEEKKNYQRMKFQHTVSQIEGPQKLKQTRHKIARVLTELNARRHEAEHKAYLNKISAEK